MNLGIVELKSMSPFDNSKPSKYVKTHHYKRLVGI